MADYLPERKQEVDQILEHHGVKGMRWGVITKKASSGAKATGDALKKANAKVNSARKARASRKAAIKADKTKGGNRSYKKLTNTELQSRIRRLEQEQRYRELKADGHIIRGRKVTREILENSLTKAGSYALTKALRTSFDSAFDKAADATVSKAAKGKAADRAVKTAQKAAEKAAEAAEAVKTEWNARPPASTYRPSSQVAGKAAPKQIERKKSYRQTKPSPKKKRYPRNPGSTAK